MAYRIVPLASLPGVIHPTQSKVTNSTSWPSNGAPAVMVGCLLLTVAMRHHPKSLKLNPFSLQAGVSPA
jgi:hypothetical protein